jgi:hypothetical protein
MANALVITIRRFVRRTFGSVEALDGIAKRQTTFRFDGHVAEAVRRLLELVEVLRRHRGEHPVGPALGGGRSV